MSSVPPSTLHLQVTHVYTPPPPPGELHNHKDNTTRHNSLPVNFKRSNVIQTKTAGEKSTGPYECIHHYRLQEMTNEGLMNNLWSNAVVASFLQAHNCADGRTVLTQEQNLLFWRTSVHWKCHKVMNQLSLTRITVVEVIFSLRPPQHCK